MAKPPRRPGKAGRASRRALWALIILRDGPPGLLRMRRVGEAILAVPHPEEAAQAAVSKDAPYSCSAQLGDLDRLFADRPQHLAVHGEEVGRRSDVVGSRPGETDGHDGLDPA